MSFTVADGGRGMVTICGDTAVKNGARAFPSSLDEKATQCHYLARKIDDRFLAHSAELWSVNAGECRA